jgi:activating signal cointegrator 1
MGGAMKVLTVWQPYASLLVMGLKEFETRGWETKYRGPLVIHAAKLNDNARKDDIDRVVTMLREHGMDEQAERLFESCGSSFGCAVGVVDLTACIQMMDGGSDLENAVGYYGEGRFGWKCDNPRMFESPIPVVGKQGLWNPSKELIEAAKKLDEV